MSTLTIRKGKTYAHVLRWGVKSFVYSPITNITKTAPMVVTSPAHGLPDGWPVAIVSVVGMDEVNASKNPPAAKDYRQCKVIDGQHVEFNSVNAANFKTYKSGGYLQYYAPADLTGVSPRMVVWDKPGGSIILSSDHSHIATGAAPLTLAIDNALKTITFTFTDETTAAIVQSKAVFEVEIEDSLGATHYLDSGAITFIKELAT